MIYIQLIWTFLQIGALSVGGGYAMIPFITRAVADHAWMSSAEITDMLAISQMSPGPFYLNAAIFVGIHTAGFWGAMAAIVGVILPSLIITLMVARFFQNFREKKIANEILQGVRPAVFGLIAAAACTLMISCVFGMDSLTGALYACVQSMQSIDWTSLVIIVVALICLVRLRLSPLLMLAISAAVGVILFMVAPQLVSPALTN